MLGALCFTTEQWLASGSCKCLSSAVFSDEFLGGKNYYFMDVLFLILNIFLMLMLVPVDRGAHACWRPKVVCQRSLANFAACNIFGFYDLNDGGLNRRQIPSHLSISHCCCGALCV